MVKVSVIIPVFNKEKYLDECLISVMYQTYKDIEIICVNDGSTDKSLEIINAYAMRDNRIRIINQSNCGAGEARNKGIEAAVGKYLLFLDADDFFEYSMIEKLIYKAELKDADITICKAAVYDETSGTMEQHNWLLTDSIYEDPFSFDSVDNIFKITQTNIWNKLYKADFINENNIRFQNIRTNNDTGFSIISLFMAKKITYIDNVLVYYRKNDDLSRIDNSRNRYSECCSMAYKYAIAKLKAENVWNCKIKKTINYQMYWSGWYELSYFDSKEDAQSFVNSMIKIMKDPQRTKLQHYFEGYSSCRFFYLFGVIPFLKSVKVSKGKIFYVFNIIRVNRYK